MPSASRTANCSDPNPDRPLAPKLLSAASCPLLDVPEPWQTPIFRKGTLKAPVTQMGGDERGPGTQNEELQKSSPPLQRKARYASPPPPTHTQECIPPESEMGVRILQNFFSSPIWWRKKKQPCFQKRIPSLQTTCWTESQGAWKTISSWYPLGEENCTCFVDWDGFWSIDTTLQKNLIVQNPAQLLCYHLKRTSREQLCGAGKQRITEFHERLIKTMLGLIFARTASQHLGKELAHSIDRLLHHYLCAQPYHEKILDLGPFLGVSHGQGFSGIKPPIHTRSHLQQSPRSDLQVFRHLEVKTSILPRLL